MKKGFTLIELLGVIILLGVLTLIVYPMVDSSIKASRQKAYEQTVRSIENAAKMYGTNNKLSTSAFLKTISLDSLKEEGYLKNTDLIDPSTKKELTGCVVYSWNHDANQFEYSYNKQCLPTTPTRCLTYEASQYLKSFTINYDNCKTFITSKNWKYSEEEIDYYCKGGFFNNGRDIRFHLYRNSYTIADLQANNVISDVVVEKGIKITDYDYTCSEEVILPDTINDIPIKEIDDSAFRDTTFNLTKVDLSQATQLEIIDYHAFEDSNINQVIFGKNSSLKYIGERAFDDCSLESIDLPDSLQFIALDAFDNNLLTTVEIPPNVVYLSGFDDNYITTVTIPDSVEIIGEEAFEDNDIISLTLPKNVRYIGNDAFENSALTSLVIPDSVRYIDDDAFENNNITSLVIPNNVEFIGKRAFDDNAISTLIIPSNVKRLGSYAFEGNVLTELIIENGVEEIGLGAFGYNSLTTVTIPNSVKVLGANAFQNNNLTSMNIDHVYNAVANSPWGVFTTQINWMKGIKYSGTLPANISISDNCTYNGQYYSGCVGALQSMEGKVTSFKLNNVLQNGNSLTIPEGNFTITDVTTVPSLILESSHPYTNNMNQTYTQAIEGSNSLSLQFSAETLLETTYDKLKIYDKNNTLIGTYTGNQLAGQNITITGDTVKLVFTTDSSVTKYGFYVEISRAS